MTDVPEMIERVARAIWDADNGIDGDAIGTMIHASDLVQVYGDDKGIPAAMEVCRTIARAAIAAMSQWQLIDENTPRDGSEIILGHIHGVCAGFWNDGSECRRAKAGFFSEMDRGNLLHAKNVDASHWQPLPVFDAA